jgi:RecA/RadA recombinase
MSKLMDKLLGSGSIKNAAVLAESTFFNVKDNIPTSIPIINVAFSGRLDGGLVPGVTFFAGPSKSYKTLAALFCMKAYLDKYPDGIAMLFDSEFGVTPEYLQEQGIDSSRVIHIPIEHLEQLKFDMVKRLDAIERGDKVFIMIDSLGSLSSKKEVEDALEEKSVADMTRAKAIRSLLRIITPHLTMKDLPCIIINHTYSEMGLFPRQVMGGGTATVYSANQVFFFSRSQEKDGTEIAGWNFTITIEKSRFVREKSKLTFQVMYETGMNLFSGLMDLALESGHCSKPKNGWYLSKYGDKNYRLADTNTTEFWNPIVTDPTFQEFVKNKFMLTTRAQFEEEDDSDESE